MNKILFFTLCCGITFLLSCKKNTKPAPALDKNQFAKMLIDIHITDGSLSTENVFRSGNNLRPSYYYNSIYEKYGITREQFKSCLSYYSYDTKEFTKMYDVIIDSLNRLETKYRIELKNQKIEQDTVNLWSKKQHWRVPSRDSNDLSFAIPVSQTGIYTIKADIKVYRDDQTENPKIEAYFWKKDSLGEDSIVSFEPKEINKNRKFDTYEIQMEYTDSTYTELRGNLFAGENDLDEFTEHFEIKNILIFNPQIRPDSLEVMKELIKDQEVKQRRTK
jgi:hypothetical protein